MKSRNCKSNIFSRWLNISRLSLHIRVDRPTFGCSRLSLLFRIPRPLPYWWGWLGLVSWEVMDRNGVDIFRKRMATNV